MYDIRQFKPALYVLLSLGITGFALASQSPLLWVVAMFGVLLNAWLVKTRRFRPIPRFVANVITILALAYVAMKVRYAPASPILLIGQFLVLLQLVKLYEVRANRDYAQLLVLSLLLMVAAAISTASLLFGLLFFCYLFLSLFCCLLFHLKVETDHAKAALGISEDKVNPLTLRQDQRYLTRSMRRVTGLVAAVSVSMAVLVFLFFPRGTGAGLLGPLQWKPQQTLTGFSETMSFQSVARITQSEERVGFVKLWHNEQPVRGGLLYLRGVTHDVYVGSDSSLGQAWSWTRSPGAQDELMELDGNRPRVFGPDVAGDTWRQEVMLEPTGTNVLFAIAGPVQISVTGGNNKVRYSRRDETLHSTETLLGQFRYEVVSRNRLTAVPPAPPLSPEVRAFEESSMGRATEFWGPRVSNIDPQIEQYARRPETSGSDAQGPLAARRPKEARTHALDREIAKTIERHLQTDFAYTLDLTDARRVEGRDPMVAFLYDLKRGHCEYFAGAMTLLCQSLGMQARVVLGFKCDDFNPLNNTFQVSQNHAHAWVEVLMPDGTWESFDPTSGRDARATARANSAWQRLRHLFNYLEYTWANSVVAYNRDSRQNLMQAVDKNVVTAATTSQKAANRFTDWLTDARFLIGSRVLSGLIGLLLLTLCVAIGWYLWERWKLRQRARRIGIDALPPGDQRRLARQLGFYDDLIRLLERHQIVRPRHMTPREFADSITFLPGGAYDAVRRLTGIFYRIRYGQAELSIGQRRRLHNAIDRLEAALRRHPTP